MAVSHILEDVNIFMQIFEPALFDIDTRAQVLHMWSVFTSQNIFIYRKHVSFWIMYNNYSVKALLNFIWVVFINHYGIKK